MIDPLSRAISAVADADITNAILKKRFDEISRHRAVLRAAVQNIALMSDKQDRLDAVEFVLEETKI